MLQNIRIDLNFISIFKSIRIEWILSGCVYCVKVAYLMFALYAQYRTLRTANNLFMFADSMRNPYSNSNQLPLKSLLWAAAADAILAIFDSNKLYMQRYDTLPAHKIFTTYKHQWSVWWQADERSVWNYANITHKTKSFLEPMKMALTRTPVNHLYLSRPHSTSRLSAPFPHLITLN